MDNRQGRGRSKSRGITPSTQPPNVPPQPQGAWQRRPGISQQQPPDPTYGPPPGLGRSVRPVTPQGGPQGDRSPGVSRPDPQPSTSSSDVPVGSGGGDAAASAAGGRGAMRGKRIINTDSLVTRPTTMTNSKMGTLGNSVRLKANFFEILSAPKWCLFQYHVDFSVEEDRLVVRKALVRLHKEVLGTYLFDGTVLYTCARLLGVTADHPLQLTSKRESDQTMIIITVRLVGDLVKGDPHYMQLYNIIVRRGLEHLHLQLVGRNYFDAGARVSIPEFQFELWPGYMTTVRQHERSILLGVEVTHKVMRQQTVMSILNDIRKSKPLDLQGQCKREVIGLTVLTDYNNNTYRVDDIDFSVNPQTTFEKKGVPISYMDYYQEKYGIRISNPTQPLLLSRSNNRDRRAGKDETVYLVPELCRATGITDSMKTDFRLMKAMADHTRVNPRVRIDKLMAFNQRLVNEPNVVREFSQWELRLDQKLVDVPARILPQEKIFFANRKDSFAGDTANWTNSLRNSPMIISANLNNWFCVAPERLMGEVRSFVSSLIRVGQGLSFNIGQPQYVGMRNDTAQGYTHQLEDIMSKNNPQLVFCVSLRQRADVYSAIKKKCCVDRPVPSQVLLAKHFKNAKGLMSIATKVAIQLNCKIGGAPWSCQDSGSGLMVVGFDVCHDPNQRGTDIGAMVASLDRGLCRYFSAVSRHTTNEELSNDFGVNMIKAVRKYHAHNKAYPEQIVIYRDGVGDGQISYVFEHEVKTIQKSLAEFYGGPEQVRLTFVIVTKRINTRFFLNSNNPPPGTVVDDVVTNPNRYDFFIVSQHVGQGSVSPTAYNVIHDNSGFSVNNLQLLSYRLTHMYYNWCGTVRVPAPCQYAHKLAFLVSQSIHRKPSSQLETLLYFL